MRPVDFPDTNITFVLDGCADLPAFRGGGMIVTCWRPSWLERLRVLLRGRVWVALLGDKCPPLAVAGGQCVFVPPGGGEGDG